MKAILVMDMPENCVQCLFGRDYDYTGEFICAATDDWDAIEEDYFHSKPDWCPLRPLPEKQGHEKSGRTPFTDKYVDGWNACLDAIGGHDETPGDD